MLSIGIPAVRILAVSWLLSIPNQVIALVMQGLSRPGPSMLLTMARQAILPVVIASLLSLTRWLPSIWLSFVAAELICVPLAIRLWRKCAREVLV